MNRRTKSYATAPFVVLLVTSACGSQSSQDGTHAGKEGETSRLAIYSLPPTKACLERGPFTAVVNVAEALEARGAAARTSEEQLAAARREIRIVTYGQKVVTLLFEPSVERAVRVVQAREAPEAVALLGPVGDVYLRRNVIVVWSPPRAGPDDAADDVKSIERCLS